MCERLYLFLLTGTVLSSRLVEFYTSFKNEHIEVLTQKQMRVGANMEMPSTFYTQ